MFAGVGERTREGNDLYREMIESGVIKLGDKQVIQCGPCAPFFFSPLPETLKKKNPMCLFRVIKF